MTVIYSAYYCITCTALWSTVVIYRTFDSTLSKVAEWQNRNVTSQIRVNLGQAFIRCTVLQECGQIGQFYSGRLLTEGSDRTIRALIKSSSQGLNTKEKSFSSSFISSLSRENYQRGEDAFIISWFLIFSNNLLNPQLNYEHHTALLKSASFRCFLSSSFPVVSLLSGV